ncbi:uncharacterized protein LOC134225075 [Armigeres subalbatus]|uniref:uncharacterized protein LOC134225075 n=1 Tax=Armigeres subalbatus TaxID=124917 RepID=UPI002ED476E0
MCITVMHQTSSEPRRCSQIKVSAMRVSFLIIFLIIHESCGVSMNEIDYSGLYNPNVTNADQTLSRKKRFLLFPVGANLLVTASGVKSMIFKGPGGNVAILELDMYHPLPDYKNRITQLKLGEIAGQPKPPPPPTLPPLAMADPHDHHYGHELSDNEVQEYLKAHPDTWVPQGYAKDRTDWFPQGTYNPYPKYYRQSISPSYNPYKSNLWGYESSNSYRMKRSDDATSEHDLVEGEDKYNISHHRDWEHYYHYREKRDLYHTLEHFLGGGYRLQMKSCIMRAICEARSFLLPKGRSMMMDILRILFSVPLKNDLQDDYSQAMRHDNMDCHDVYGKECSVSILYLILFGKFSP